MTGGLGTEGSLIPNLFTDLTRNRNDFPLARPKSANLGEFAGKSRFTICQELLPTSDCNEKLMIYNSYSEHKTLLTHNKAGLCRKGMFKTKAINYTFLVEVPKLFTLGSRGPHC